MLVHPQTNHAIIQATIRVRERTSKTTTHKHTFATFTHTQTQRHTHPPTRAEQKITANRAI